MKIKAGIVAVIGSALCGVVSATDVNKNNVNNAITPASSWTGLYLGINGGYGVGNDPFNNFGVSTDLTTSYSYSSTSAINSRVTPLGGLFGGQIGYNYQRDHWVFGVTGDLQWDGQTDNAGCGLGCARSEDYTVIEGAVRQDITWFSTARGRMGWAQSGWFAYVTGGGAWSGINTTTKFITEDGVYSLSAVNTTHKTKRGWVVGAGTEIQLAGALSATLEYLYMDFGRITDTFMFTTSLNAVSCTTHSWVHDNVIRIGLNYRLQA